MTGHGGMSLWRTGVIEGVTKAKHFPDSVKWPNVFVLPELLSIHSIGTVERMFPVLKLIKPDCRTYLHASTLSDLLDISIEGLPWMSFLQMKQLIPGRRHIALEGVLRGAPRQKI